MTKAQEEIIALATEDIRNGINVEWAEHVIAFILENAEED